MEEFIPLEKCVFLRLLTIYTGSRKKWKINIFEFVINCHRIMVSYLQQNANDLVLFFSQRLKNGFFLEKNCLPLKDGKCSKLAAECVRNYLLSSMCLFFT